MPRHRDARSEPAMNTPFPAAEPLRHPVVAALAMLTGSALLTVAVIGGTVMLGLPH